MAMTVEVWGSEGCSKCDEMAKRLELAHFEVLHKDFELLSRETDRIKRDDIMSAYSFEQAFPILFFRGKAHTPKEFHDYLNSHGFKI